MQAMANAVYYLSSSSSSSPLPSSTLPSHSSSTLPASSHHDVLLQGKLTLQQRAQILGTCLDPHRVHRLEVNKKAAKLSRERKKEKWRELQEKVEFLTRENALLKQELKRIHSRQSDPAKDQSGENDRDLDPGQHGQDQVMVELLHAMSRKMSK